MCVDNSEWTRDGDYAPTRFQAQTDAVNLLAGAKTQHHPENTVGVMRMAGASPRVLVTPTTELGKVLNAMSQMEIEGDVHLATAIQIAQLALKHRENKNQRQRIVIFIGSPIREEKVVVVRWRLVYFDGHAGAQHFCWPTRTMSSDVIHDQATRMPSRPFCPMPGDHGQDCQEAEEE